MEHIRILLLGVSFRVYISYKTRTRQKSRKDWKSGNGRNAWSPQRVHFSDWSFQKFVLDHANSQMYQSHKTLHLRREMSLPLTFIRPFRDNPQSCPYIYHVAVGPWVSVPFPRRFRSQRFRGGGHCFGGCLRVGGRWVKARKLGYFQGPLVNLP